MSMHLAEWVACELIAATMAGLALYAVWQQYRKQDPPPGGPD